MNWLHVQSIAFKYMYYMIYGLYIAIALGLSVKAPQYLDWLLSLSKLYVSLFLIWRFNPFRRVTFTKLDATVAFSAGTFLLATTAINTLIQAILSRELF